MFLKSHKHFYFKGRDKQCSWWGLRWQTCQKFHRGFFFPPNWLLRRNAQLACYSFCICSRSFWWVIWGHGLETFQSWKDDYMLEHMEGGLKRWPSSCTKKLTRVQFPDLKSGSSPLPFTPDPGVWHSLPASTDTHACAHGHRNTEIYAHKI